MLSLIAALLLAAPAGTAASARDPALPAVRPAQQPPLAVAPMSKEAFRPLVHAGPILDDAALADAVRSGIPLRLRYRVELWRDRWIDQRVAGRDWAAVILYDPLEDRYLVRVQGRSPEARRYATYAEATVAATGAFTPAFPVPSGRGLYYTASLRVETLSLSDLDELRNWLKGDLGPAVGSGGSLPKALEDGAKRALIRVLGLPARVYDARSQVFDAR